MVVWTSLGEEVEVMVEVGRTSSKMERPEIMGVEGWTSGGGSSGTRRGGRSPMSVAWLGTLRNWGPAHGVETPGICCSRQLQQQDYHPSSKKDESIHIIEHGGSPFNIMIRRLVPMIQGYY